MFKQDGVLHSSFRAAFPFLMRDVRGDGGRAGGVPLPAAPRGDAWCHCTARTLPFHPSQRATWWYLGLAMTGITFKQPSD